MTDHSNRPLIVANAAGTAIWASQADPFGVGVPNEDYDQDGVNLSLNLRFPGQYFDAESGLHYNLNRYYDPTTGRYLESDPIGLKGGLNTYAYVGGNPVNFVDPLGLDVFLQTHPVTPGIYHSKVTIIPNNQSAWANDSRFSNSLPDGRKYLTLGAGPEGGNLVSGLNRPRDVDLAHNVSSTKCPIPEKYNTEDDLIKALLAADQNYQDNFDYELFPLSITDGYNSNSYVNGLLDSVGINMPNPGNTAGFDKQVPSGSFSGR